MTDTTPPADMSTADDRKTASVAHDFNNVLMVVLGNIDAALLDASLPESARQPLERARDAAERGARLIEHLLLATHATTGSDDSTTRRVDQAANTSPLDELVAAELAMLREVLGEQIDLVVDLSPATGVVAVTAREVSQILLNLAVNARDAMPDGGTVRISSQPTSGPPAPGATVVVADDGPGMSPETRERLFEPFFSTKQRDGSGLGLATAASIVVDVGGTIAVDSEPGAGATFTVWFPNAHLTVDDGDTAARAVALVADDDPEVRRLVAMTLRSLGHHVHESTDGIHALAAADHFGPALSLLVTDINMPGIAGVELANRVQRRHPWVPTLLMTGYADQTVTSRSRLDRALPAPVLYMGGYVDLTPLRGPGRGLLRKPFDSHELSAAVRAVTSRRPRRGARRRR